MNTAEAHDQTQLDEDAEGRDDLDEQARAEMFDEESLGEDEIGFAPPPDDGRIHGLIGSPDQLGADDIAELVATEYPSQDQLAPEEAAMHVEEH